MEKRISNFDFARAIAIIAIVICHYFIFGNLPNLQRFGGYMGAAGVFVFLSMSSILFGLKFSKNGKKDFSFLPFMRKRLLRLGWALWPFLLFMVLLYLAYDVEFRERDVILNFAFLGWFGKLPGLQNLWYITMNVFLYYAFCGLSLLPQRILKNKKIIAPPILLAIALEFYFDAMALPGYMFVILVYGSWFFIYAKELLNWIENLDLKMFAPIALFINVTTIYVCYHDTIPYFDTVHRLFCDVSGFTWLIALLRIGNKVIVGKTLLFISGISYEVYLVHHALCAGPFNVYHISKNPILAFAMIIIGAFAFGFLLHVISHKLSFLCKDR